MGCVGADVEFQASTSTIQANWSSFSDPDSGLTGYQWAIGTTPGGMDVQGLTSAGITGTSASNGSLSLLDGQVYYVTIRANNSVSIRTTVPCVNETFGLLRCPPV